MACAFMMCRKRAQLVTRVGDEIRAHFLDPADRGEVMQRHQHELATAVSRQHDRLDETLEPAVGYADLELEPLALPGRCGAADRVDHVGDAQRK
jgi:hypothetical protein